jgi:hypothetical protein
MYLVFSAECLDDGLIDGLFLRRFGFAFSHTRGKNHNQVFHAYPIPTQCNQLSSNIANGR